MLAHGHGYSCAPQQHSVYTLQGMNVYWRECFRPISEVQFLQRPAVPTQQTPKPEQDPRRGFTSPTPWLRVWCALTTYKIMPYAILTDFTYFNTIKFTELRYNFAIYRLIPHMRTLQTNRIINFPRNTRPYLIITRSRRSFRI